MNHPHKFVWSVPMNSYTLASNCEYCGLCCFYSNDTDKTLNEKEAKSPCPNSPHKEK